MFLNDAQASKLALVLKEDRKIKALQITKSNYNFVLGETDESFVDINIKNLEMEIYSDANKKVLTNLGVLYGN